MREDDMGRKRLRVLAIHSFRTSAKIFAEQVSLQLL
jgi:hypothetical protein